MIHTWVSVKFARADKIAQKYFCNAWLELDKEKKNEQINLKKRIYV